MGFPVIFLELKHVVPSLNRTTTNNNDNNKNLKKKNNKKKTQLYYLAIIGPVVAGEEQRLRFAKSISFLTARLLLDKTEVRETSENCKFYTQLRLFL